MIHPYPMLVLVAGVMTPICGSGGYAPGAAMIGWLAAVPFCFKNERHAHCQGDWVFLLATSTAMAGVLTAVLDWLSARAGLHMGWGAPMSMGWWPTIATLFMGCLLGGATLSIIRYENQRMVKHLAAAQAGARRRLEG